MELMPSAREMQWRIIGIAAATYMLAALAVNAFVFRGPFGPVLRDIYLTTRGLIQPTLLGGIIVLAVFMTVVVVLGRVSPVSVGWVPVNAAKALLHVGGFWVLMQGVLVVLAIAGGQRITLHPVWHDVGPTAIFGGVLAQVLGNALAEETAIRGFFFTQFLLKSQRLQVPSVAMAASASSLLFAVSHLANQVFVDRMPLDSILIDQVRLFFYGGVLFALVFVATRNLFTVVGLHALSNDPAPIIAAADETVFVTYLVLVLTILLGAWITRRLRASGVARTRLRTAQPTDAADRPSADR